MFKKMLWFIQTVKDILKFETGQFLDINLMRNPLTRLESAVFNSVLEKMHKEQRNLFLQLPGSIFEIWVVLFMSYNNFNF